MKFSCLIRTVICAIGIGVVFLVLGFAKESKPRLNTGVKYYDDADLNMQSTLGRIDTVIRGFYSGKSSVRVETTYSSFGVLADNISQTALNDRWNREHPSQKITGVCGIVSNTMLLRKYMTTISGLPQSEDKYTVYEKQMKYAWGDGNFFSGKKKDDAERVYSGTNADGEVELLDNYIKKNQSGSKLRGNVDTIGNWSTLKSYLNDKIRLVKLSLEGKNSNHSVLATACYVETVSYKKKVLGINLKFSDDYEIVRICNGWNDSAERNYAATTHSYVFFDCVYELVKLK